MVLNEAQARACRGGRAPRATELTVLHAAVASVQLPDQMIYYTWCSSTEVEENENDGDGASPCEDATGGQPCSHPSRKERHRYKLLTWSFKVH